MKTHFRKDAHTLARAARSARVRSKVGLLLVFAVLMTAGAAGVQARTDDASLTLVLDGEPKAVIVLPDAAGRPAVNRRMEERAAQLLAEHLGQMTGAELKVYREKNLGEVRIEGGRIISDRVSAEAFILVGESELSRRVGLTEEGLTPGGMLIQTTGNALGLLGPPDGTAFTGGTMYAATTFLENLGCRYLWPGELGRVVPRRRTVTVEPMEQRFTPPIGQRTIRIMGLFDRVAKGAEMLGFTGEVWSDLHTQAIDMPVFGTRAAGGWGIWHRLGGDLDIRGGHAFGGLWKQHGQAHPEWFALQPNGSRTQHSVDRARLCVSNAGLIEAIANQVIEQVNASPNTRSVSLSPNDGGQDVFCMCEACKALDPPQGPKIQSMRGWNIPYVSLTDRYVYFWNGIAERVARVHPDLLFVIDAYSVYSAPPVERTLHSNLVVRFVPASLEDWDAWRSKASKIFWRPNMLHGDWRYGTLEFHPEWGERLRYVARHGGIATDFDKITHNWATQGLDYYILARLNWDPDLAVDQVVDDYCRHGFGSAAELVRQYFQKVAELTCRQDQISASTREIIVERRGDPMAAAYTPEAIAELRAFLDAADEAAGDDEVVRQRIAFLRVGLDWTDVQARSYRMLIAWKRGELDDWAAASRLVQQRRDMMRTIFQKHPLAVSTAYVEYGSAGYWRGLLVAIDEWKQKNGMSVETARATDGEKTIIDADEEGRPIELPAR